MCSIDNGMEICSCERGYLLDIDSVSCIGNSQCINFYLLVLLILYTDVDECDVDDACSHNCTNTNGSFVCSCNSGYALDSDSRTCIGTYVDT